MRAQGHMTITEERRRNRHGRVAKQRGRPRSTDVKRDASGKSRGEENPRAVALAQPHRIVFGADAHDEKAECHHGRYSLAGQITKQEHEAGKRYFEAHVRYLAALAVPDSLRRSEGGSGATPDAAAKRNVQNFEDAFGKLDKRAAQTLAIVLFRDQPVPFGEWMHYKRGLIRLAQHYGMGE